MVSECCIAVYSYYCQNVKHLTMNSVGVCRWAEHSFPGDKCKECN